MITANSFMKREFGKKLIEEYLPQVNLDLIINTSGAYIPGHGTPTVLLFGTLSAPSGKDVLAVLAKRGEPTTPEDAEHGQVWRSIADHWNNVGFENDYLSISRVERTKLAKHPWSLGGGGAAELKELLEDRASGRLGELVRGIGVDTITRASDLLELSAETYARLGVERACLLLQQIGEKIRDWGASAPELIPVPYDRTTWKLEPIAKFPGLSRFQRGAARSCRPDAPFRRPTNPVGSSSREDCPPARASRSPSKSSRSSPPSSQPPASRRSAAGRGRRRRAPSWG